MAKKQCKYGQTKAGKCRKAPKGRRCAPCTVSRCVKVVETAAKARAGREKAFVRRAEEARKAFDKAARREAHVTAMREERARLKRAGYLRGR